MNASLAITLLCFVAAAKESAAGDGHLRKFRWPEPGASALVDTTIAGAPGSAPPPSALPGAGEWISREAQSVGGAVIRGSWRQRVYNRQGELIYSAGEVAEQMPRLKSEGYPTELPPSLRASPALKGARETFPATLELDKNSRGEWEPSWRVEYLSPAGDELRFVRLSPSGQELERGRRAWDGVDGRAMVFPRGPRLGGLEERPLRDLSGDGTISGRMLNVVSALGLKVWAADLKFFFPESDRRFDLGQAYFTIDQGFRWLKENLGVQMPHPVAVKLHVGEGGVSNAAFYHANTIYLGTGDGETYRHMLRDPSVLIHESIHAVVDAYAGLPAEGEGGAFNEGFADLFTALILNNPRMGEVSYLGGPYRRTLEHNLQAYRDFTPGVYQNGSIVAATFWDLRPALGSLTTAKLAFRTLSRLGRGARFDDFPGALEHAGEGLLSEAQKIKVKEIARRRGWRIP